MYTQYTITLLLLMVSGQTPVSDSDASQSTQSGTTATAAFDLNDFFATARDTVAVIEEEHKAAFEKQEKELLEKPLSLQGEEEAPTPDKKPLQVEQDVGTQLLTYLLYPISLVTCAHSEYVYEDCLNAGGKIIVNEINAFIENDPSLKKFGLLNVASNAITTAVDSGATVKEGDREMIAAFEQTPDWQYFSQDRIETLSAEDETNIIKKYYTQPEVGGGPITQDLKVSDEVVIETPIVNEIASATTYGFYELDLVRSSEEDPITYYDLKVLVTAEEDAKLFVKLADFQGDVKCCWTGGHDINERVNGFARIIKYKDIPTAGQENKYAIMMLEGQVELGVPKGFVRYIYATSDLSFIGYLDGFTNTQKGMGLFFEKDELVYSGIYEEGTNYEVERPEKEITDLTELEEIAKQASCGQGFVKDPFDETKEKCIRDPKIVAIEMFNAEPAFDEYKNDDNLGSTASVETQWKNKELGGGPLTGPLSTPSQPEMSTPLQDLINEQNVFGFYTIPKIQQSADLNLIFHDVWLLINREKDSQTLHNIQKLYTENDQVVCCWVGGTQELTTDTRLLINGFGRVIKYESADEATKKDRIISMWEGELVEGEPYGFSRFIQGLFATELFIGSLQDFDTTMKGSGVYIYNEKEAYSGLYQDGQKYREDRPIEKEITIIKIECPDYQYEDPETNECISDLASCGPLQILNIQGKCEDCGAYLFPDDSKKVCVERTCEGSTQFLTAAGTCEACPVHKHPNAEKRGCTSEEGTCVDLEKYLDMQGYCKKCPDYEYPNDSRTACRSDACAGDEILLPTGRCQACEKHTRPAPNSRECISDIAQCTNKEIVDEVGECKVCEAYHRPSEDKKSCIQDECPAVNEMRQINGECETCQKYMYANSEKTACLTDLKDCTSRQIVTELGRCEDCAEFTYPDAQQYACTTDVCESNEYKKTDGTCELCQSYHYPDPEDNTKCISDEDKCKPSSEGYGGEFLKENGKCEACPDYTYVSGDKRSCVSDESSCDARQILDIGGKCQTCDAYTYPDETSRKCIDDFASCTERQKLNADGKCEYCDDYYYRDSTGRGCTSDLAQCTDRQIIRKNGKCGDCDDYKYPEPVAQKTCIDDSASCAPNTQVLDKLGKCEDCNAGYYVEDAQCVICPEYNYIDAADGGCKQETCTGQDILLTTGRCSTCEAHYGPDSERRKCIQPDDCTSRERTNELGQCEACPTSTYPDTDTHQCVSDAASCTAIQILNTLGRCEDCDSVQNKMYVVDNTCTICPDYKYVNDAHDCVQDTCTGRQQLKVDGKCRDCEEFTYPDATRKNCVTDTCQAGQRLDEDGTCKDCPDYTYVDASGKNCIADTCKTNEMLTLQGKCEGCALYTHLDATTGKGCVAESCTETQKLLETGYCEDCGSFSRATADGKSCAADTCGERERLQTDGTCSECPIKTFVADGGKYCTREHCFDNKGEYLGDDGKCVGCEFVTDPTTGQQKQTVWDPIDNKCEVVSCPKWYHASYGGLCHRETCVTGEALYPDGVCEHCPVGYEPNDDGKLCKAKVCPNYFYLVGNDCRQDTCEVGLTHDKEGKCTIPRCDALRESLAVNKMYPPRNAYKNLEDMLRGYNIFTGSPFGEGDVGFAAPHSVYDWSKFTTQGEWTAPKELEVELLSRCDEDTTTSTVVDPKSLQDFYFADVTMDGELKATDPNYEFKPAFTGSRDFKGVKKEMSSGKYVIAMASAKCLVYRAKVSESTPPCLSTPLLDRIKAIEDNGFAEDAMNEFFDDFGTHTIQEADFGAKFLARARYERDTYFIKGWEAGTKGGRAEVVFATKEDRWGIKSPEVEDGELQFKPDPALSTLSEYALGVALPEAQTTAERLKEWAKRRDDIMDKPEIASNMRLITLPEYLMDMLKAEDPESVGTSQKFLEKAVTILNLAKHLELKYCQYLKDNKRGVDSCEEPEAEKAKANVVLEKTSSNKSDPPNGYYKVATGPPKISDISNYDESTDINSETYYGHPQCFSMETEREKTCTLPLKSETKYTKYCKLKIDTGYSCSFGAQQTCATGPKVREKCWFKKDGITFHGRCNGEGRCEGEAKVALEIAVGDDGYEIVIGVGQEKCEKAQCTDYRGRQNKTVTGKLCQRWDASYPHYHNRTPPKFPLAGLDSNYCRNPDGEKTIWCYTEDPNQRWEYCKPLGTN